MRIDKRHRPQTDIRRQQNRKSKLMMRYGITHDQYMEMLEEQDGVCKLCQASDEGKYGSALCVDHDHDTGEIRGLLCHNCNTGIGKFNDDTNLLEMAIEYLKGSE